MARERERWDVVQGQRVFVRAAGPPSPATPIVLIHGLGVSGRYMVPLLRRLGERFAVHAPDLPGFGRSPGPADVLDVPALARFLSQWMKVAGLRRAVLVGNSMGCQVAVDLAARLPDQVAGLVLLSPTMDPSAATRLHQIARWLWTGLREPPLLLAVVVLDYLRCGFMRLWRTFAMAMMHKLEPLLSSVHVPTLVVRGVRDRIVSQAWAECVARRLPLGRLIVLPGGAHALNYDDVDGLVPCMIPFVEELGSRVSAGHGL